MSNYWRTLLYLVASGIIWFAEDYVFSRGLGFNDLQTGVVTGYFAIVFIFVVVFIVRLYRRESRNPSTGELPVARIMAMAPALTVVVGSFAALPIIIAALLLGRL